MVDRETFDRRLAKLEDLLRHLRELAVTPKDVFLADRTLRAATERSLQLAAECTLDIAHHLIADKGWPTPTTYKMAFQALVDEGVLDTKLGTTMQNWAGLRNLLVHLYLDVDQQRLYEILQHNLDDLERFARAVVKVA